MQTQSVINLITLAIFYFLLRNEHTQPPPSLARAVDFLYKRSKRKLLKTRATKEFSSCIKTQ